MKHVIALSLFLFLGHNANAGDAGCGLGSIIFRDNTKLIQLFAMTTNHTIFFNQALGITFGTSNCTASGIATREKEQIYYVELNFDRLKEEMAQGSGEHLEAFAGLLGCPVDGLAQVSRGQYSEIVRHGASPMELLVNTKRALRTKPETGKLCQNLG